MPTFPVKLSKSTYHIDICNTKFHIKFTLQENRSDVLRPWPTHNKHPSTPKVHTELMSNTSVKDIKGPHTPPKCPTALSDHSVASCLTRLAEKDALNTPLRRAAYSTVACTFGLCTQLSLFSTETKLNYFR